MKTPDDAVAEVSLPKGASASVFLHDLLGHAAGHFRHVFEGFRAPPTPAALKKKLGSVLLDFEQRRRASPRASEIAAHIVDRARSQMRWRDAPLSQLAPADGLTIERFGEGQGTPGWAPQVPSAQLSTADLRPYIDALEQQFMIGAIAAEQARKALTRIEQAEGRWDLSGERFALLGAGAEIAPTQALLEGGATVLWCDVHPPPEALRATPGRLLHAGRADLLTTPDRIAGAIRAFAEAEGSTHLGLFAYAPGKGQEWRLGAAMNAVARSVPADALRSVGLYISPTSPASPESTDVERAKARWAQRPAWQRALSGAGVLRRNRSAPDAPWLADVVVGLQGLSYQAAQYVEKTLAMEALAIQRPGLRQSAPVAPITRTRSLEHPLFAVAFRGTRLFDVQTYAPDVTRALCALIYLQDVLGTPATGPRYFHGGLFSLPFALEGTIRVAAVRGAVSRG